MANIIRSIKKFSTRKIDTSGYGVAVKDTEPLPPVEEGAERETIIMTLSPIGPISPLKNSEKRNLEKEKRKEKSKKETKEKIKKDKSKGKERERVKSSARKTSKKKKSSEVESSINNQVPEKTRRRKKQRDVTVARENEDSISDAEGVMQSLDNDDEEKKDEYIDEDFSFAKSEEEKDSLGPNFSCLTQEEIIQTQKKLIQEISEKLNISPSNAANLLRHYRWKVELLHQQYWPSPDKVFKEVGLVCVTPDADDEYKLEGEGECLVCCEIVDENDCCSLKCRHRFCNDCWSCYLKVKITEGEVARINCPALNCKYTVPDQLVQKLVDKEIYEKYLRFVTKTFVEDNAHITWCPAPRCGNAITADMLHGTTVKCRCGFSFCFSCHNEAHAPATCEQVKLWQKKCSDDSETSHWLGANTKECPRCTVVVEKNGGCNHMTCRQCTHEWCWMCHKPWKGHTDYYSCARYEKAQKKKAEKEKFAKKKKKTI